MSIPVWPSRRDWFWIGVIVAYVALSALAIWVALPAIPEYKP